MSEEQAFQIVARNPQDLLPRYVVGHAPVKQLSVDQFSDQCRRYPFQSTGQDLAFDGPGDFRGRVRGQIGFAHQRRRNALAVPRLGARRVHTIDGQRRVVGEKALLAFRDDAQPAAPAFAPFAPRDKRPRGMHAPGFEQDFFHHVLNIVHLRLAAPELFFEKQRDDRAQFFGQRRVFAVVRLGAIPAAGPRLRRRPVDCRGDFPLVVRLHAPRAAAHSFDLHVCRPFRNSSSTCINSATSLNSRYTLAKRTYAT